MAVVCGWWVAARELELNKYACSIFSTFITRTTTTTTNSNKTKTKPTTKTTTAIIAENFSHFLYSNKIVCPQGKTHIHKHAHTLWRHKVNTAAAKRPPRAVFFVPKSMLRISKIAKVDLVAKLTDLKVSQLEHVKGEWSCIFKNLKKEKKNNYKFCKLSTEIHACCCCLVI